MITKANNGQSALCLWTSADVWPTEVASIRRDLCAGTSEGFTEPQLRECWNSVLRTFRELNLGDDSGRPAKRRKTLPDTSEDVNRTVYEGLKAFLVGSSQESPVLNLANFHTIVQ
jgi:serine/threonine-protein kinase ATR